MDDTISLKGLNKAAVLAVLYNNSRVQGLGILQARDGKMTVEDAQKLIDQCDARGFGKRQIYFDYLHGKVMKVNLTTDELDPWLYDRDNGPGAAARAIDSIR